jgi:hypothetical protein
MENPKEKLLFPGDIALIIWFCVTLAGTIALSVEKAICRGIKFGFFEVAGQWIAVLLLFFIQSVTAKIIGDCYAESEEKKERIILIVSGVLHAFMILADMALFSPLAEYCLLWLFPVLSVVLFLLTGIYIIFLRHFWRGIVVLLFAFPAFFQPVLIMASQQ